MKKLILLAAFVQGAFAAANAQSGNLYIGGTLGFTSGKTVTRSNNISVENPKTSSFVVLPEVGYFFTPTISAGIAVGIGGDKTLNTNVPGPARDVEAKTNFGVVALYGRKFIPVTDLFSFYGGINIGTTFGKTTTTTSFDNNDPTVITESKTNVFGVGLNAGINYMITPRVTFMGSFAVLGFLSTKNTAGNPEVETTTTNFGLNVSTYGNPFSIGMYYTIN